MVTDFWNFVKSRRVSKKERKAGKPYNFVSQLEGHRGCYQVEERDFDEFLDLYVAALKRGDQVSMSECWTENVAVYFDLDFVYDAVYTEHQYSPQCIHALVRTINDCISTILAKPDNDYYECYVLEKSAPSVKGKVTKSGIHIQYPKLVLSRAAITRILRPMIIDKIRERDLFGDMPITNSLEDVIDDLNEYKNAWLMYGSVKSADAEAYDIKRKYHLWCADDFYPKLKVIERVNTLMVRRLGYNPRELKRQYEDELLMLRKPEREKKAPSDQVDASFENVKYVVDILAKNGHAEAYNDWLPVMFVLRDLGEDYRELAHEFSAASIKYDADSVDKVFDAESTIPVADRVGFESLVYLARKYPEFEAIKLIKPAAFKFCDNQININKRYISHSCVAGIDWETLLIVSPMGTGKTRFMKDYISTLGDQIIIALTTRRSLATKLENDFGFTNYLNTKDFDINLEPATRIIISIESIYRLRFFEHSFTLFVDEAATVFHQLFSSTVKKHMLAVYDNFSRVMRKASKVLLCDATFNEHDFETLQVWRKRQIHVVYNSYVPQEIRGAVINTTSHSSQFLHLMVEAVNAGKRIVVFAIKKSTTISYGEYLKTMCPNARIIVYNADTKLEQKLELQNVNNVWINYDVVIYNSSIDRGISFDTVGHFDQMFGNFMFNSILSNSPATMAQSLRRVRSLNDKLYTLLIPSKKPSRPRMTKQDIVDNLNTYISIAIKTRKIEDLCGQIIKSESDVFEYEFRDAVYHTFINHEYSRRKGTNMHDLFSLLKMWQFEIEYLTYEEYNDTTCAVDTALKQASTASIVSSITNIISIEQESKFTTQLDLEDADFEFFEKRKTFSLNNVSYIEAGNKYLDFISEPKTIGDIEVGVIRYTYINEDGKCVDVDWEDYGSDYTYIRVFAQFHDAHRRMQRRQQAELDMAISILEHDAKRFLRVRSDEMLSMQDKMIKNKLEQVGANYEKTLELVVTDKGANKLAKMLTKRTTNKWDRCLEFEASLDESYLNEILSTHSELIRKAASDKKMAKTLLTEQHKPLRMAMFHTLINKLGIPIGKNKLLHKFTSCDWLKENNYEVNVVFGKPQQFWDNLSDGYRIKWLNEIAGHFGYRVKYQSERPDKKGPRYYYNFYLAPMAVIDDIKNLK